MIDLKQEVAKLNATVGDQMKTTEKMFSYANDQMDRHGQKFENHNDRLVSLENLRMTAAWFVAFFTGLITLAWNSIEEWFRSST